MFRILRNPNLLDRLFALPCHHFDGQDRQDDPAGNRHGAAGDVEEPHEQRTRGKQDERGNYRRHDHPPAYGPLRLGIEVLGLFEKWHERNFGTHADEQEQEKLRYQGEIDDREIHEGSSLAC
jgi:hypothetical protein